MNLRTVRDRINRFESYPETADGGEVISFGGLPKLTDASDIRLIKRLAVVAEPQLVLGQVERDGSLTFESVVSTTQTRPQRFAGARR